MRQIHLFILLFIMTISCTSTNNHEPAYRYLALGDSYTIGESVADSMRYPLQIADSLRKLGWQLDEPDIIAVTGWTTRELLQGIENADPQGPYRLVSLLIGVNNQYRGLDIDIYRKEFLELLNKAIAFAGNQPERVIVLSIPDWGVFPFAEGRDREKIGAEIDQYNMINKEITLSKKCVWIDVTGISRLAENDTALVASDGLHPSGLMYGKWVDAVIPEIIRILEIK